MSDIFKEEIEKLQARVDELEKSAIEEIISNENGVAIKYANGYMKCFATKAFICNYQLNNDSKVYVNTLEQPFVFPVPFKTNPTVVANTINDEDYAFASIYSLIRNKQKIQSIVLTRFRATSLTKTPVSYVAEGFWK